MTPPEVGSLIRRLLRREVSAEELSALTVRDLDAITEYLTERAEAWGPGRRYADASRQTAILSPETPPTFTEQEILAELEPD